MIVSAESREMDFSNKHVKCLVTEVHPNSIRKFYILHSKVLEIGILQNYFCAWFVQKVTHKEN